MSAVLRAPHRRCAIYTRKSSEEGLEQDFNSLHAQREACEAFIKSQAQEGWEFDATVYDDGGYSGGSMDRPGLKRLLQDVSAGQVQVIVVYKVDRLTRSLADFARIIEQLDAHDAAFVSVTQQFSTTTSMGRLTLNVLLSFAQFEREVTGERIRDKIAASKRKGMWMGGGVPLGYAAKDRTLVIVPSEAQTVRHIYQRYLELKSVDALAEELRSQGIGGRPRKSADSAPSIPSFSRGALYHLLRNPVYLGQIRHKELCHAGQHPALIDEAVWKKVQSELALSRRKTPGAPSAESASALRGKIFDSAGHPMTTTYARKEDGRRYRYYVSQAVLKNRGAENVEVPRIAAHAIEPIVQRAVAETRLCETVDWAHRVGKVVVRARDLTIDVLREEAGPGTDAVIEQRVVAVNFHKRGHETRIVPAPGTQAEPCLDRAMIHALVRAHRWRAQLESGEAPSRKAIARAESVNLTYVGQVLNLAFLAPDLTEAILNGHQPPLLMLKDLRAMDIPLDWNAQRKLFSQYEG